VNHQFHDTSEQQDREGQNMQARERCRQSFIITREATKTRGPRETALHDPAAGQQHKAFFGLRQFGSATHVMLANKHTLVTI
jgi:hypothetical protein